MLRNIRGYCRECAHYKNVDGSTVLFYCRKLSLAYPISQLDYCSRFTPEGLVDFKKELSSPDPYKEDRKREKREKKDKEKKEKKDGI